MAWQQYPCLIKHLDNMSDKNILEDNIPTGIALVYELGEEKAVKKATKSVADQVAETLQAP